MQIYKLYCARLYSNETDSLIVYEDRWKYADAV